MAKISVLVAVYNAEKYLSECLSSLVNQSLSEIEIICIDDASTDGSAAIMRSYAERDARIKTIFLKENHGQAFARNEGLKIAMGDIICFVDSDDWLAEDALESMLSVFSLYPNTDVVLFELVKSSPNGNNVPYPMRSFDKKAGYEAFVDSLTWAIHGVYGVRKEIHLKYPYDTTCRTYSDDNTTRLHYLEAKEVRQCAGIYYYRQHADSVTHVVNLTRFNYLVANQSMKAQLEMLNVGDDILKIYEKVRWLNIVDLYFFYYMHRKELTTSDRKEAKLLLKRYWKSIETPKLPLRLKLKFGYMPIHWCWKMFCLQEELYFSIRGIMGKNIEA